MTAEGGWTASGDLTAAVERAAAILEAAGPRRVAWTAPWLEAALDITRRYWRRAEMAGSDVERQLIDWDRFREDYLTASEHVDILLTPVTPETAPLHRELTGEDFVFTLPASLTGSPAIAVPFGLDPHGMPMSIQIIGRPWEDQRVLAVARLVESQAMG